MNYKLFTLLLSAGFLLSACSSDDDASNDSPAGSTWTLTVKATKGGNETDTRALSLDGKTLNATWATTEKVHVYSGSEYLGELHPVANAVTTDLNGSLRADLANSYYAELTNKDLVLQFPQAGQIYYTEQIGTIENISNKYDWATATVHIDRIDLDTRSIIPTSNVTVDFENQQAIVKFTLKDKAGNSLPASSLTISATGLIDYGVHTGDVTINPTASTDVIWAALRGINETNVTLTATVGSDTYTYTTKSAVTFENGKYYEIIVKMTKQ